MRCGYFQQSRNLITWDEHDFLVQSLRPLLTVNRCNVFIAVTNQKIRDLLVHPYVPSDALPAVPPAMIGRDRAVNAKIAYPLGDPLPHLFVMGIGSLTAA